MGGWFVGVQDWMMVVAPFVPLSPLLSSSFAFLHHAEWSERDGPNQPTNFISIIKVKMLDRLDAMPQWFQTSK